MGIGLGRRRRIALRRRLHSLQRSGQPRDASITQQQIAFAKLPNPVILSGTERRRREVKSKDPEIAFFTMPLQGVLTNIYPLFRSSKPLIHYRVSNPTTLPATTISTQRSQANQ